MYGKMPSHLVFVAAVAFIPCIVAQTPAPPLVTTTMDIPLCHFATLPPDYGSQCNATNSFTLPNGRFVDQNRKFCRCNPTRIDVLQMVCSGAQDLAFLQCNPDGTYNCIVSWFGQSFCSNNRGSPTESPPVPCGKNCNTVCAKEAYCQSACIRYSKEGKRFQNIGACPCSLAQSQEMDSSLTANDNYVPQCNMDGSWQKQQTGYGGHWCVDANGNQTGDISFNLSDALSCY